MRIRWAAWMFDTTINRWGTHSAKWDLLAAHLGDDALSLSVADMEFATCPEVSRAIMDAIEEDMRNRAAANAAGDPLVRTTEQIGNDLVALIRG